MAVSAFRLELRVHIYLKRTKRLAGPPDSSKLEDDMRDYSAKTFEAFVRSTYASACVEKLLWSQYTRECHQ